MLSLVLSFPLFLNKKIVTPTRTTDTGTDFSTAQFLFGLTRDLLGMS